MAFGTEKGSGEKEASKPIESLSESYTAIRTSGIIHYPAGCSKSTMKCRVLHVESPKTVVSAAYCQ